MAGNTCKLIILVIPALATVGLLSFCLLSDWWIKINQIKLDKFKISQETAFNQYLKGFDGRILNKKEQVTAFSTSSTSTFKSTTPKITTKTTTSTTTTTTTHTSSTTSEFMSSTTEFIDEQHNNVDDEHDEGGDNGNSHESFDNEEDYKRFRKLKRRNANETENSDYSEFESDENPDLAKQKSLNEGAGGLKIDHVYITQLWPLIKYKSLYYECVAYEKLRLVISVEYLNQTNKEPILGTIHYGSLIGKESNDENNRCKAKLGQINCLLNKQCVYGTVCDGIVDCDDQTDEQFCDSNKICHTQNGFQCDNRCWQFWNKCDQVPHCLNLSDELSNDCTIKSQTSTQSAATNAPLASSNSNLTFIRYHQPFTLGKNSYDFRYNCFKRYFDFKSASLIGKETLKYLSQPAADTIQETNNINYHLQLIYSMAFSSALCFSLLALISLLFMICFKKLCFQCPFWFYGFFQIISWLACSFGIMTFIFQFYSSKYKSLEPNIHLPYDNEIIRNNFDLLSIHEFGVTFWVAVAATATSLLGSILSCIICCRLPSARHENKTYKIMQLPTYQHS